MSPQVTVRFWAGARRAAGRDSEQCEARTLAQLLDQLSGRQPLAEIVRASSILVNGVAATAETPLPEGATIDILPPFAGG
ncbi:MAG: sulfur-carrier protein [Pseudonocardiales bacterium]|jgi:molybdopterin converting factor small subunit|nr:sulfur-carrier protein [Pseudonocardiales bacterium]